MIVISLMPLISWVISLSWRRCNAHHGIQTGRPLHEADGSGNG